MTTAQDVLNYALRMLAQTQASIAAGFAAGTGEGDSYAITPANQAVFWIEEAQNRLGRLCVPIYDSAQFTAQAAGDTSLTSYQQLISVDGRTMHQASSVAIGTKTLTAANMGFLISPFWYKPALNGDPTAWANNNSGIALSAYTTQPTFTINGFFLPTPVKYAFSDATAVGNTLTGTTPLAQVPANGDVISISGGSTTSALYTVIGVENTSTLLLSSPPGDSAGNVSGASPIDTYLDDYCCLALSFYTAWRIAQANQDNTVLGERIPWIVQEFAGTVKEIFTRLVSNDSTISGYFAPQAIDAQIADMKQILPKT